MNKMKSVSRLTLLVLIMFWTPLQVSAEDQWHFQAALIVPEPGLTEAVLPAGLCFGQTDADQTSQLDLSLIGPDGNPRSFELYWKEDNSTRNVVLESNRVYTDRARGLVWEGTPPKNFLIEDILIDFAAQQGMGKVTVEAKDSRGWHLLAEDAALYQAEDRLRTDIKVKPAAYEHLRLSFKGYDQKFRETPFLVKTVTLSGKNKAKDYYEQTIDLHGIDNKKDGERVISALLPGSSLLVKDLVISTSAQFQGRWKLGHEVMSGGKKQFEELFSGDVTSVGRRKSDIEIQINRVWPGRSLILKLDPVGKYLGSISALKITAYLPRLVFFADKAGTFLAQSGNGNKVRIKNIPGDQERQINKILSFTDVIENDKWRPESLVEKLSIAGGPFNEKGYRWTSSVAIPESGYYRLVLNQEASLSRNPGGLRLARDLVQIPYFRGQSEMQKITLQGISDYDKTRNTSVWTIQLPEPSNRLTEMTIESNGIFERKVMVEIAKPGHTGWQQWKELYWQNLANTPTVLHIGLEGLSKDTTELRIRLNHGDNRPIEISKIEAVYYAPTILFLINKPGEYVLFGGNPDAPETRYDLNLVQAHLTEAVPMPAMMEKTTPFRSSSLQLKVQEIFDDKSWGLYVVLGIVTLVLIILIIRLFPKAKKTET